MKTYANVGDIGGVTMIGLSLSLSLCTGLNCFSRWFIGPNLNTTGSKSILLLRGPLSTGVLVMYRAVIVSNCVFVGNYCRPRETFIDLIRYYFVAQFSWWRNWIIPIKFVIRWLYKSNILHLIRDSIRIVHRILKIFFISNLILSISISKSDTFQLVYISLVIFERKKRKEKNEGKAMIERLDETREVGKNLYRITPVEFPWYKYGFHIRGILASVSPKIIIYIPQEPEG